MDILEVVYDSWGIINRYMGVEEKGIEGCEIEGIGFELREWWNLEEVKCKDEILNLEGVNFEKGDKSDLVYKVVEKILEEGGWKKVFDGDYVNYYIK